MRKHFTEEQIIKVLSEHEAGLTVAEVCRKHGLHVNTLYKWRQKYAGMAVSDVQRLRALEDENRRLKQIVADQALDIVVLKDIQKNFLSPK
jgi:putative transposase